MMLNQNVITGSTEQVLREDAETLLNKITGLIAGARPTNDTLFGGELAIAFYFAYLYELTGEERHAKTAVSKLEGVLNAFNANKQRLFGPFFCNGLGGMLFIIILFVEKKLIDTEILHEADLLEEQLVKSVLTAIEGDYNDALLGSFGCLNVLVDYAILKNDHTKIRTILSCIEKRYMHRNNPWIVSSIEDEPDPFKVNFSLSHGQSGLLLVLLKAYTVTGHDQPVDLFLRRNIDFVMGFYSEDCIEDTHNHYPYLLDAQIRKVKAPKRLAWCYGDLGQVLLSYQASVFFGDERYFQAAEKAGYHTTLRRTFVTTMLDQPTFCHGTCGVAQVYRTLLYLSDNYGYSTSYLFWIRETIDHMNRELALSNSGLSTSPTSILEGLPGIGLTLMSFLSTGCLNWGRVVLL